MHCFPSPFLLADAAPTTSTAPTANPDVSAGALVFAIAAALVAVVVAWRTGVFRPARLGVVHRIPPGVSALPLVGVLFAALVVWLSVPSLFVPPAAERGAAETLPSTTPAMPPTVPTFQGVSTRQLVVLNTTIPVVAFLVLVVGDVLVRPRVGQQLGWEARRIAAGVLAGTAGLLLALPLVYAAMVTAQWAFRRLGYEHPDEHELLRAMGDTPDAWVKYLAILAAVVVAPVWEELLFRGHIQTLIRERLILPNDTPDEASPDALSGPRAHPLHSWVAILVTSMVFASVHQPWTIPPIFVLSICLGLAYERTNNLWVPVIMHSGFNSLMTAYFLLQ